ncbi:heme exporter protein CcmB [Aristophania vespae]|uniref:heme exporter protein CcmB n=1 Tax=Aristophania vespae TaxID=2697033 RepID=UPI00235112DC|nr:heme exporter protein CcmB [Aristophania vespae]UMM64385.1 Heme exporter protein B [Aristophania vespae]
MRGVFPALLERELRLAIFFGADTLASMLFFILCAALFPLALGPSPTMLHQMAPGILWVCLLLSSFPPLDRLFNNDFEDGSLDQLMISGLHPAAIALAKMIAHWLTTAVPLLIAALILGLMFGLEAREFPIILGSLALGSASLSLIGGMVAAISLGARRGNILLPLLGIPLSVPILIFGAGASYGPQLNISSASNLYFLGAFFFVTMPLCPLAASMGLKEACR